MMSDPIVRDAFEDRMGEQFPSRVREVLRAFVADDLERATITDVAPATLQAAISTLGLRDLIYAETRGNETVLRKVPA